MKHIKSFENNKPTQIYYIIPMENIKEIKDNFKMLKNADKYNL